jgi:hypothetical protein
MFSPEFLNQYDAFCNEFRSNTDIDSYNTNLGYFNGLGNNDEFAFNNWDESQDLRTRFEAFLQENFPNKFVDCGFSTSSLSVYNRVAERSKHEEN